MSKVLRVFSMNGSDYDSNVLTHKNATSVVCFWRKIGSSEFRIALTRGPDVQVVCDPASRRDSGS